MSDDASFDPRFAPEFQRGFSRAPGSTDAPRTARVAPGLRGMSGESSETPSAAPGERRRARGGATARDLPGHRTAGRSLIGMPPEEAARLSPYGAGPRAEAVVAADSTAPISAPTSMPPSSAGDSPSVVPAATPQHGNGGPQPTSVAPRPTTSVADARAGAGAGNGNAAVRRRVSPWRNPWLYVLFVAGAALTGAGFSLTQWSLSMMYGPSAGSLSSAGEPVDYTAVQIAWILGPPLVIVGGATLMGALFFVAASWLAARPLFADAADDAPVDGGFSPFDDGDDVDEYGNGNGHHDDEAWNRSTAVFTPFGGSPSSGTPRNG